MRQTLFSLPYEVAGIPVFGVGLLLALCVFSGLLLTVWVGRRQGWGGDTWTYPPLIVVIAAVVGWLLPRLAEEHGVPIRGYGVVMLLAILAGTGLAAWRARRVGVDPESVIVLCFWGIIPGVAGARVFHIIQYWHLIRRESIYETFVEMIDMTQGGLVVYGALIGGGLGIAAYIYFYKVRPLATLDLITPTLLLGLAIGRIGCVMNGCCYGGLCDNAWQMTFPWGSPAHVHQARHGQTYLHGLKVFVDPHEGDRAGDSALMAGPVIREVQPGSKAEKQGVRPGGEIVRINGHRVDSVADAQRVLLDLYSVDLLVETDPDGPKRDGPLSGRLVHWMVTDPDLDQAVESETEADSLTLRGATFVDGQKGHVLIGAVNPHSWAGRSGRMPGERIREINGRLVRSVAELRRLLVEHESRPWISIGAKEESGSRQTFDWTLPLPRPGSEGVHPTQLYSAINAGLLCLFLLAYAPFRSRDGQVWAAFLTLYAATRFLLEMIRTDEGAFLWGFTISQTVSLAMLTAVSVLWVYILRQPRGTAFPKHE